MAPEGEAPPGHGANSLAAEPMPLPAGVSQPCIPEAPQALVSDGPPSPPQLSSLCQLLGLMRPSSLKRYRGPETVLPGQEQQPKASAQLDHKVSNSAPAHLHRGAIPGMAGLSTRHSLPKALPHRTKPASCSHRLHRACPWAPHRGGALWAQACRLVGFAVSSAAWRGFGREKTGTELLARGVGWRGVPWRSSTGNTPCTRPPVSESSSLFLFPVVFTEAES